jgi:hypothetical protein
MIPIYHILELSFWIVMIYKHSFMTIMKIIELNLMYCRSISLNFLEYFHYLFFLNSDPKYYFH